MLDRTALLERGEMACQTRLYMDDDRGSDDDA